MKSIVKRFHLGQKGFTLIELLVVIAILGVLAAVAIPNLAGLIGRGEDQAALTEFSIIQTAVVAYMADNGIAEIEARAEAQVTTADAVIGSYMSTNSGWLYSWAADGKVTQGAKYVAP
jgi:type IV pilus assembly protein PilA